MTLTGEASRRMGWLLGAAPLGVWALLLMAGYFPTKALSGLAGIRAMLAAQSIVLAVVYLTLLPPLGRMVRAGHSQRFQMALKAGVVRFFLTILLAVLMAWRSGLPPIPFLVWIAIAYVVMIQVETFALVRWMKRLENPT